MPCFSFLPASPIHSELWCWWRRALRLHRSSHRHAHSAQSDQYPPQVSTSGTYADTHTHTQIKYCPHHLIGIYIVYNITIKKSKCNYVLNNMEMFIDLRMSRIRSYLYATDATSLLSISSSMNGFELVNLCLSPPLKKCLMHIFRYQTHVLSVKADRSSELALCKTDVWYSTMRRHCWLKLWLMYVASMARFRGEFKEFPSSWGGSFAVSLTVSRSAHTHTHTVFSLESLHYRIMRCM